mmetsp:Transcript_114195/g.201503  ORF Transcript_114195/g.201503 Transcript_114195/m.201503 type:complete len:435 (-) Transcript_114195:187-1491(-)
MGLTEVRSAIARLWENKAVIADLGKESKFYWNSELNQWVEVGKEHLVKPKEPLPPPPIDRMKPEEPTETTQPASLTDVLMRPPQYQIPRPPCRPSVRGVRVMPVAPQGAPHVDHANAEVLHNNSPPCRPSDGDVHVMPVAPQGAPQVDHANVEALATANYEKFHMLPEGTSTVAQMANSSAGLQGWAAAHLDDPQAPAEAAQVDNAKASLGELRREIAETRRRAIMARHAQSLRMARQQAWNACLRRGLARAPLPYVSQELHLALSSLEKHQDTEPQHVLDVMRMLWVTTFDDGAVSRFLTEAGLTTVIAVLRAQMNSDAEVQIAGFGVLHNVAQDEVQRASVIEAGGLTLIVEAMRQYSNNDELLQIGWQTLFALAVSHELKSSILASGAGAEAERLAARLSALLSAGQCGKSTEEAARWGWKLQEILDYEVF